MNTRVVIIGAGIGGLASALSLRGAGFKNITVLEQAPALTAVGAGIQLSANAVRLLRRLGIGDDLERFGVRPDGLAMRSWQSGERLLWTDLGERAEQEFGAPYYHAHRADLLDALVRAWGIDNVRLDTRVASHAETADGVSVRLENGEEISGDVLIGADGIHSGTRQQLFGPDRPRATGLTALRGLVEADAVTDLDLPRISAAWLGPGRSMVHYWVAGGRLMNWIGIVPASAGDVEDWGAQGTREEALHAFEGWHPTVRGMIERTGAPFKMTMYDRPALQTWGRGRVTLLGDACHAMLPFHAQGACMAIEDAWVLARCLQQAGASPEPGLRHYEDLRMERANWVQEYSRQAEQMFHLSEPEKVARRDAKLKWNQDNYPEGFPPGQIRIYGYDAEAAVAV